MPEARRVEISVQKPVLLELKPAKGWPRLFRRRRLAGYERALAKKKGEFRILELIKLRRSGVRDLRPAERRAVERYLEYLNESADLRAVVTGAIDQLGNSIAEDLFAAGKFNPPFEANGVESAEAYVRGIWKKVPLTSAGIAHAEKYVARIIRILPRLMEVRGKYADINIGRNISPLEWVQAREIWQKYLTHSPSGH